MKTFTAGQSVKVDAHKDELTNTYRQIIAKVREVISSDRCLVEFQSGGIAVMSTQFLHNV